MRTPRLTLILAGAFAVALAGCEGGAKRGTGGPMADVSDAHFVGRETCARCHEREAELWQGSHHDLAMQVANEETVLADFNGTSITYNGIVSAFSEREGEFFVRTDGPDGEMTEYRIDYAFGVEPLQQYLIRFPDGRIQALSICWDSRPLEEGGQRWFHLYPDEGIDHRDPLHWTSRQQNWNYMCAECHSTNLRKNYDSTTDHYDTTWSEIDVSCEACHGPGSAHVGWSEAKALGTLVGGSPNMGLAVRLRDLNDGFWAFDPETSIAARSVTRSSRQQVEACGRCHSRRSVLAADYTHGRPLSDTHRPAVLDEGLYHADGMILDEVYVYGSFLQSKMYRACVTCSDCHDPHSAELVTGDSESVCVQCHLAQRFATPEHHFHQQGTSGSRCVDCHMPYRTYMGVDERNDHGFRIPRPDLSLELGTPNACNDCHSERPVLWAADAVDHWYGRDRNRPPDYLRALDAGRGGAVDAELRLASAIDEKEAPGIFRATATSLLGSYLSPRSLLSLERALDDSDPLVRAMAVSVVEVLPPRVRLELAAPLLGDPVRLVRIEAARALVSMPEDSMSARQKRLLAAAVGEYRHEQHAAAERPEAQVNLGTLQANLGDLGAAEERFQRSLAMDPLFLPAYVNLADLYRLQQRDDLGEKVLRQGLTAASDSPALHHALGLLLVRQQRSAEALESLSTAVSVAPQESRYVYVYGVALHSGGDSETALSVLAVAHDAAPGDREILWALATISRESGSLDSARIYAEKLSALLPQDPTVGKLLAQLQSAGR